MTAVSLTLSRGPGNVRARRQSGYLLLEATVVAALMASAVVAYIAIHTVQTRFDQGKAVGAHYARINEALGQYMTLHYEALKKLAPDCSVHGLAAALSKTIPGMGTACNLTVNAKSVYNGLQPTVAELVALSLLPAATTDALQINALVTISEPNRYGNAVSGNWTRARLHAVITQSCVATQAKSTLQGRYVLVRRPVATENLAFDEIEVMVNGSNIANASVLSSSTPFNDGQTNAAAYYATGNLVDRLQTLAPNLPYQLPGLFRSLGSNTGGAWVQLDLGMQRDISSIGLRAAQGNSGPGATGNTWAAEGSALSVSVNNAPADGTGNFLTTATSQIRQANATGLLPGNMVYVSSDSFSAGTTLDLTPTAQGCPNGSLTVLSSLLFNTQPYELPSWQGSGAMLATVIQTAGTEAAMSNPLTGGELSSPVFSIPNPLRLYDPSDPGDIIGVGVGGIIAVRNGYQSYNRNLQTRADGSNPPTSAWNFNNKNLTSVDNFESASASVRGDIINYGALYGNKAAFSQLKLPLALADSACSNFTQDIARSTSGQLLTCSNSLWKSLLANTINTQEYFEIDILRVPNGFPMQSVQYCVNASCSASSTPVLGTLSGSAYLTTLRTDQWFPVVGSYEINTQIGINASFLDSRFGLEESGSFWSIDARGITNVVKLKIRFYKINT
jgi:hypothetical protein